VRTPLPGPHRHSIARVPIAPFAWTYEKTSVTFDGEVLTVNDKRLPLSHIERLAENLSVSTAPGTTNRLDCSVRLFADCEVTTVGFHGDATVADWGPWRPSWDLLDALVRDEIEPRLLGRTLRAVASGSPAEIGSLRAKGRGRFTVTAEKLQLRQWLARPIPWRNITEISGDALVIVTVDPSGKRRHHATGLATSEWDAWQIPLLWREFGDD
jgi:hypothetical protein